MVNDSNINSKEYWNRRFVEDWEKNAGRKQTLFFCDLTIKLIPKWFEKELEQGLSVGDIGCAEGDCTNFLSLRYPASDFTGIDFSNEAIEKASSLYPNQKFIAADIRNLSNKFDVVYSSNTLEHFHNPFEVLEHLFQNSNKYVVLLLPFQERNRFNEHFFTFEYSDFRIKNGDFTLVYSKEYDCSKVENIFWAGKQILLIYQRNDSIKSSQITLQSYIGDLSEDYDLLLTNNREYKKKVESLESTNEALVNTLNKNLELTKMKEEDYLDKVSQLFIEKERSGALEMKLRIIEQELEKTKLKLYKEQEYNDTLKRQETWLLNENYKYSHELKKIYSSDFWKLARIYYKFRDKIPGMKYLHKSVRIIRNQGFMDFYRISKFKMKSIGKTLNSSVASSDELLNVYQNIREKYQKGEIDKVAIIPAAFPFDELYNQRTINLAKYLSQHKTGIIYSIWQWNEKEEVDRPYQEVYKNVYGIPMYSFLNNIQSLKVFSDLNEKYAFLNIPSKAYVNSVPSLRINGFSVVYDIMDEWEEFSKVGQALWFDKNYEESLVLQADKVIAVSKPLLDKFSHIRNDIICIGNGYFKSMLGEFNVSRKNASNDNIIHIGYFGHLTESWFDWNLVFEILENKKVFLHLIGYGASESTMKKLKGYKNIKYYGKVNPSELGLIVRNWHVGIIPFTKSKLSEAVDPIKIYEYLYFGLPVVSTGIKHVENYPGVKVSDNVYSDFLSLIEQSYALAITGGVMNDAIIEFLENTSWESRFSALLNSLDKSGFVELYNE